MKLSPETIAILKNFASINTNILVRTGNELRTISTGKSVFAKAKIQETFPVEFAIYDLNSLLALLTLMDDQDIDFGHKSLTISKDGGKFEYFYSSPSIIVAAPTKNIEVEEFYNFAITAADIQMINKAASIVGAPTITLVCDGKSVSLVVGDKKNDSANNYSKIVGAFSEAFEAHISVANFIVMPDNYEVVVSKKKLLHFKAATKKVEYFIAMEPDSKF